MADLDNIIRMAREAGVNTSMRSIWPPTFKRSISFTPEELERFAELVIADFLQRTGQYLTNDATREAAIAEAVAAEREAIIGEVWKLITSVRYHCSDLTAKDYAVRVLMDAIYEVRARGQHG